MTDSGHNAAIDESIEKLNRAYHAIRDQMGKVIVGQSEVIDQLLIALFSRGHCLLEGVPGLAKTLMISTLARCLSMSFSRIQFTPDLMPADITGTDVLQENGRPASASSASSPGRCSTTWCWPTRSTARRPRRRPPCWKPCRSGR